MQKRLASSWAVIAAVVVLSTGATLAADKPPPLKKPVPASAGTANAAGDALWGKNCEAGPGGKQSCYVFQSAVRDADKARLLYVLIGYLGEGGRPRMIMTTPLGVLLPAGLAFKIDDQPVLNAPFETCDQGGCRVVFDMDSAVLDKLAQGKQGAVRYLALDKKPIDIPVKLDGLAQALKSLR